MPRELERLAERVIQVANENIREVAGGVAKGPRAVERRRSRIKVDTLKYDASVFALGALGTTVFLFVNSLVGGVLALAAPVLALVLRGRVATGSEGGSERAGADRRRRVAALIGPKLDEIIDGFGARLLEFVSQAGDALHARHRRRAGPGAARASAPPTTRSQAPRRCEDDRRMESRTCA